MKLKLRENADINTVTGISDIIIDSINKKWDNIRDFNSIIVNLNDEGYEELVPVIESILEDENRNVGKLQQLVELISPTASSIDDGRQEAIDELDGNEIKVEEEMKLDENFPNVPKKITTNVDPVFGKAVEDKDRDEKEIEDALKENEKLAKETIPKEGETGKKVTSKALKAMHLSESLFDEDLSFNSRQDLVSNLYNVLEPAVQKYVDNSDSSLSWSELESIWEEVLFHLSDEYDLDESLTEAKEEVPDNIKEIMYKYFNNSIQKMVDDGEITHTQGRRISNKILKQLMAQENKKKDLMNESVTAKQVLDMLNKVSSKHNLKIRDDDKKKFISKTLKKLSKLGDTYDDKEKLIMVDRFIRHSFNSDGELYTESANVKMDIAREQIKKFKEGKMPKDWTPKEYINDLVSRKHITKEEGEKLLSEDFGDIDEGGIESFRSYAKQALFKLKEAYNYITHEEQYSEAMHSLIEVQTIIDRLMDEMGNQYLDGDY